ncbi:MAG: hypothetical protein KDL87_04430 [Verrucomicrobiae bacterium]|nr:hypothetical protein [Verrucomicrobiae bacterium]
MNPFRSCFGYFVGIALAVAGSALAWSAEPDFYQDVYPFLKANCIACHNKTTTKAGLNMETPALMIKGGDTGPSIVPGKSGDSLLVEASVHSPDFEMPPPNNKSGAVNLTPEEIAVLKRWIDQGAKASVQQERQVTWKPLAVGVDPIYSVALTQDGRYAACGRSNRIFLYDLAERRFLGEIGDPAEQGGAAHRAMVQSLAFSPDGTRLASGSYREVKVWKLEAGKPATASPAEETPKPADEALVKKIAESGKVGVVVHAMSPDGKQVVTGCADGSVRVWDAASAKAVAELRGSVATTKTMAGLEWTVARESLEQTFQKTEVTRIEAQNKALDELLKKANDAIVAMKKVLPEKQKDVKPAQDAKAAQQKAVDEVRAQIAKAPEGKPDAALEKQLKDALEKLAPLAMKETSALAAVSAAESNVKDAEADVKRISDSKAKNAKDLAAANAAIETAKKSQDKATADLAAAKQALAKPTAKPVAVALSSDGQRAAAVFDDGRLTEWAIATGTPITDATGAAAPSATLAASKAGGFVATMPDGKTLATAGNSPWKWERTLGGEKNHSLFADRVNAVKFSPDGKLLATGGGEPSRSGDVTLFDLATGKATATWKDLHDDIVMSLDFSPDGKRLATGAADKIARVIEVATGKQVNLLEGHTHYVMGVAFRADGRVLATAGADGVVNSWNMILGELKKKIEGWTKEVTSLQFIGATNQIVTSAGDNRVRIVNDDGGEVRTIAGLPDFMQSAASTPNGTMLVGGGEDSTLRVWNGTDGKELAAFAAK